MSPQKQNRNKTNAATSGHCLRRRLSRLAKLGCVKRWPGSQQLPKLALGDCRRGHGERTSCFFWKRGSRHPCGIKGLPKPIFPDSDHFYFLSCSKSVLGKSEHLLSSCAYPFKPCTRTTWPQGHEEAAGKDFLLECDEGGMTGTSLRSHQQLTCWGLYSCRAMA